MIGEYNFGHEDGWYLFKTEVPFNSFITVNDEIEWLERKYSNKVYKQLNIKFFGDNDAYARVVTFDDFNRFPEVHIGFISYMDAVEFRLAMNVTLTSA